MNVTIGKRVTSRAAVSTAPTASTAAAAQPKSAPCLVRLNLVRLWRGAFALWVGIWVRHAPAMLAVAAAEVAGLLLISQFVTPIELQIGIGLSTAAFARGAITWLALQSNSGAASFVAACRATCRHLPALLLSSLIYGLIISAGWAGLSPWLRELHINVRQLWHLPQKITLDAWSHKMLVHAADLGMVQTTNAFIPDPGAPFTLWLPKLRATAFTAEMGTSVDDQGRSGLLVKYGERTIVSLYQAGTLEYQLLVGGGLALILCAETLLRFRVIGTFRPAWAGTTIGPRWLGPMAQSARLGLRHLGLITLHIWCLRLLAGMLSVILIIVPGVLIQYVVLTKLAALTHWTGWLWLQQNNLGPQFLGIALVNLFGITFSAAYDVQLYSQITCSDGQ